MSNELTTVAPLQRALDLAAEAGDIDTMKDVRATATALQKGAKARGMGVDAENQAAEVVLRAERAIGQALIRMQDEGAIAPKEGNNPLQLPTLVEVLGVEGVSTGRVQNWVVDWKAVARLSDETFETMLQEAKNLRERIAKVNFYRRPADPRKDGPATKDESGWADFERGAKALIGWTVGEDGMGRPTSNGLLQLPNDQLHTLAVLVQELVRCYQEAKGQR